MSPRNPVLIAFALIIFSASIVIGEENKPASTLADIKVALEGKNTELPAILAKLEAFNPTTPAETAELRALKVSILCKLGESDHAAGRFDRSVVHFQRATTLCDQEMHAEEWGRVNHKLADALGDYSSFDAALAVVDVVLTHREETLGKEHSDTLATAHSLAVIALKMGDIATAEPIFRRVMKARERTLGP